MSDYDPSELIAVCDSILEDGEISGEELYSLADWLNNHKEACSEWPGALLVEPLQRVWFDGKITKTEMRQIGRLLLQISTDWARLQAAAALAPARAAAISAASMMDLTRPQLPSIPWVFQVKSSSEPNRVYEVDLTHPTCTCPDWSSKRSRLPSSHLSRSCKHVFNAYTQIEPAGGWPGWFGALLSLSWPPHPLQDWMLLQVGRRVALVSTAPAGWGNVYIQHKGEYDRFGYNVIEDRWAYGMRPSGSEQIRQAILDATNRPR